MPSLSVLHILRTIKEHGTVSRTDLQHITGLSWGTITNTTRELLSRTLIREEGALSTKAGRKPVRLAINPESHVLVGLEISPGILKGIALNLAGEPLWYEQRPFEIAAEPASVLDLAGCMIQRAVNDPAARGRLCLGVGIAVPGAVDVKSGHLLCAARLPGWKNVPIRDHLQSRISAPLLVERDPNCLALAERWFGQAPAHDDLLCISLGEDVGLGILLGGEIYRGSQHFAGDFGHMTVDPNGPLCTCGDRGCLNAFCSLKALLAGGTGSFETLVASANAGEPAARAAFERLGHYLGLGLANLVDLLNPGLLILTGPLTAARAHFLPTLEKQLEIHANKHAARRLLISELGDRATAKGACGIVLQSVFDQQLLAPIELLDANGH